MRRVGGAWGPTGALPSARGDLGLPVLMSHHLHWVRDKAWDINTGRPRSATRVLPAIPAGVGESWVAARFCRHVLLCAFMFADVGGLVAIPYTSPGCLGAHACVCSGCLGVCAQKNK